MGIGRAGRSHLVQHKAEAEDVAATIGGKPSRLFWRHVARRAEHGARQGAKRGLGRLAVIDNPHQPGEAEVRELGEAIARKENVLRLHVAMDHARQVSLGEALGNLDRERKQTPEVQPPLGKQSPQRARVDELGGNVVHPFRFANLVHRAHVGVIERRSGPSLEAEPGYAARVPGQVA